MSCRGRDCSIRFTAFAVPAPSIVLSKMHQVGVAAALNSAMRMASASRKADSYDEDAGEAMQAVVDEAVPPSGLTAPGRPRRIRGHARDVQRHR